MNVYFSSVDPVYKFIISANFDVQGELKAKIDM